MLKEAVRKAFGLAGINVTRGKPPNIGRELALYKQLYSSESLARKKFYNVGAGGFSHRYWTNIDFVSDHYATIQKDVVHYDLMALGPLPIADGEAEIIYTSHTIEHVSDAAVENLFREAHRVLKPGGCLRVTTGPDANLDYAALQRGDAAHFYWDEYYAAPGQFEQHFRAPATSVPLEERWLHHVATQLAPNDITDYPIKLDAAKIRTLLAEKPLEEALDYLTSLCKFDPARPGNHMSWWTPAKATDLMRRCGFETVYPSGYGQSRFAVLRDTRYFDCTHPAMSLYVEAIKT
ncbi:MAG TPA: methyltransferase domain-containing protein, partial [Labilithrix sp.]|nr:methyltransferase domain-containing protein [Labilithrix sp.]